MTQHDLSARQYRELPQHPGSACRSGTTCTVHISTGSQSMWKLVSTVHHCGLRRVPRGTNGYRPRWLLLLELISRYICRLRRKYALILFWTLVCKQKLNVLWTELSLKENMFENHSFAKNIKNVMEMSGFLYGFWLVDVLCSFRFALSCGRQF